MAKHLKKLKTDSGIDTSKRKKAEKPRCPIHGVEMAYEVDHMRWACTFDDCRQVAFPVEQIEQGKPVIGRGDVEVVRVDDPDGMKSGRILLRAIDNNVIIDVTEIMADFTRDKNQGCTLILDVPYMTDNRTRNKNKE